MGRGYATRQRNGTIGGSREALRFGDSFLKCQTALGYVVNRGILIKKCLMWIYDRVLSSNNAIEQISCPLAQCKNRHCVGKSLLCSDRHLVKHE